MTTTRVVPSSEERSHSLVREIFGSPDVMTIKPVTYGEFDPVEAQKSFYKAAREEMQEDYGDSNE